VKFTVNDATVRTDEIAVVPYSSRAGWSALAATGGDLPVQGKTVYAVPGPLPSGWKVGFQADLTRRPGGPSPVEYDLVRVFSGAIPASLTFATSKASLALDHVTIRAVEPHETDGLGLGPFIPGSPGDAANPFELDVFGQISSAPYAVDLYLTPGYQWGLLAQSDVNQALVVTGKLLGGHVYAHSLNKAAFGPGPLLGLSVLGAQLRLDPAFGQDLLTDPDAPTSQSFGFPVGLNVTGPQAWIYRGSTLLTHGTGWGSTITAPVSSAPQWYTLRLQGSRYSVATRGPATGLAAKVTASFTFQTEEDDSSLPGAMFWPRVAPRGLSAANAAAHGSKTAVPFTFATTAGVIAVHAVKAWASVNGGRTWTALAVSSSSGGRSWAATVTNPAKPGWVSLRVQGTSAAGFTASVTAINAYGIS
jgi:hypothetical protein